MNLDNIEQLKIFECLAGSHAYGTNTPESDVDIRGIFCLPEESFLGINSPPHQVGDKKNDIVFYELKKFVDLASGCNPNIIELLHMPDDCIRRKTSVMNKLIENRNLFISQKAIHTFSGYAYAQIKKCCGQNKWINNPQPESSPDKLDYCYFVQTSPWGYLKLLLPDMPCRPVLVKDAGLDLSDFVVSSLEHSPGVYRLYKGGDSSRGVFRGPNQQLVCESIAKEDEWPEFIGLLIFNEQGYESAKRDWKNYWEWKKNRNEARYRSQESGEIDYDAKNLSHCMRLLWSGINIVENGEPIVRYTGEKLRILKDIRKGIYSYDDLISMTEAEFNRLKSMKEHCDLPYKVDMKAIDKLYRELCETQWRQHEA